MFSMVDLFSHNLLARLSHNFDHPLVILVSWLTEILGYDDDSLGQAKLKEAGAEPQPHGIYTLAYWCNAYNAQYYYLEFDWITKISLGGKRPKDESKVECTEELQDLDLQYV